MRQLIILILTVICCGFLNAPKAWSFWFQGVHYIVTSSAEHEVAASSSLTKDIQSITIPKFVTSLEDGERYIVRSISYSAFKDCKQLTSAILPESLTSIGSSAFMGCSSLTSINFPESLTSIGEHAFEDCSSLTIINLPESLKRIQLSAFRRCSSLISINLPGYMTSIDAYAFEDCSSLSVINFPESLTSIGNGAFMNCSSLTTINLPKSLSSINEKTFYSCSSLTSINLPESLTFIDTSAFEECSSLTTINLPESLTKIYAWAFKNCLSLTSISIPKQVSTIGIGAFDGCEQLERIEVSPENSHYIQIDGVLFKGNSLSKYPAGKKSVDYDIPESATTISNYAFAGSKHLNSIKLHDNISDIGKQAFKDCVELRTIYSSSNNPPKAQNDSFDGVPEDAVVYIPKGSFDKYFIATGWQHFTDFREWDPSGIDEAVYDMNSQGVNVITDGNTVRIANKQSESICRIYNMQGLCVTETNESEITLLNPGMYIVEIEGTIKKISI